MNLRDYLLDLNISQGEFAKILGISTGYLNSVIRGKKKPSIELAKSITELTIGKVDGMALFNGDGAYKGETKKCNPIPPKLRKRLREVRAM